MQYSNILSPIVTGAGYFKHFIIAAGTDSVLHFTRCIQPRTHWIQLRKPRHAVSLKASNPAKRQNPREFTIGCRNFLNWYVEQLGSFGKTTNLYSKINIYACTGRNPKSFLVKGAGLSCLSTTANLKGCVWQIGCPIVVQCFSSKKNMADFAAGVLSSFAFDSPAWFFLSGDVFCSAVWSWAPQHCAAWGRRTTSPLMVRALILARRWVPKVGWNKSC